MNPASLALRHSRAVLLITALVTVAGAVAGLALPSSIYPPLQFPRIAVIAQAGADAELQKPLALTVIGGLSLSTLVTLYLVPSAYVALTRRRRRAA